MEGQRLQAREFTRWTGSGLRNSGCTLSSADGISSMLSTNATQLLVHDSKTELPTDPSLECTARARRLVEHQKAWVTSSSKLNCCIVCCQSQHCCWVSKQDFCSWLISGWFLDQPNWASLPARSHVLVQQKEHVLAPRLDGSRAHQSECSERLWKAAPNKATPKSQW